MPKILVCDDDVEICKILEKFLAKKGFQVSCVTSVEDELYELGKEKFDLLIQDKKMPGIGGFGVLRELRASNDKTPVIVITGYLDKLDPETEEVMKLEFVDLLFKPLDLDILVKKIKHMIKGSIEV